MTAEFINDGLSVRNQNWVVIECDDTNLLGSKPEWEVPGVVLDEKSDEPFVRAEWSAVDAQRRLFSVVAVAVVQAEFGGNGKINLVRCDGELAPDCAPDLDIDLRPIESGFIWHFHKIDATFDQDISHHVLGLFPKLRLIHKFLPQLFGVMRGEPHLVFLQSENLEIFDIHLVHGAKLSCELLLRAVNMGVVHIKRTHAHQPEKLSALLIAVATAVFSQSQWQVTVAAWLCRENSMVVGAIHRL